MKKQNKLLFPILFLLYSINANAQNLSLVNFGNENVEYYNNINVNILSETHQWINELSEIPSTYYKFTKTNYNDPIYECIERHVKLWEQYKKNCSKNDLTPNKDKFFAIKQERDPYCTQYAKQSAPVLFFDFAGVPSNTYILTRIDIETLGFEQYFGGGFEIGEAWYDIILRHKEGIKTYILERRLAIVNGIGRIQLRLWSDNYDASYGWIAPMGLYVIKIKFWFSINGTNEISINTTSFAIDV
jgi:hypothetical protein